MVDSLWFVLALVLLAVVSVALVLVLVLRREEAHCGRETRTEYLQPNYGETGGFRVSFAPSNETPLPRPRYTGDAPGVLALGHGDTVNVVLLYILKCQVKKADGVKHLPGPGRAQAHAAARHNVVVDLRDLSLNEPVAVGNDGLYLLYSLQPEMNMIAGLAVEFVTNTRAEAVV